jgi:hypothetical protein
MRDEPGCWRLARVALVALAVAPTAAGAQAAQLLDGPEAVQSRITGAFGINLGSPVPDLRALGFERVAEGDGLVVWGRGDEASGRVLVTVLDGAAVLQIQAIRTYERTSAEESLAACLRDLAGVQASLRRRYPTLIRAPEAGWDGNWMTLMEHPPTGGATGPTIDASCQSPDRQVRDRYQTMLGVTYSARIVRRAPDAIILGRTPGAGSTASGSRDPSEHR